MIEAGQGGTFREIFHGARNTQSAIFVASFQAPPPGAHGRRLRLRACGQAVRTKLRSPKRRGR